MNVSGKNGSRRYGILFGDALRFEESMPLNLLPERRESENLYAPAAKLDSRLKIWKEDEFYYLFRKVFTDDVAPIVDFTSNDYLGFSINQAVLDAAVLGLRGSGLGTAGPAIFSGNLSYHEVLSKEVARLKEMEACLLCPSGFTANSGLFTGILMGRPAVVFLDEKDHASIFHGA